MIELKRGGVLNMIDVKEYVKGGRGYNNGYGVKYKDGDYWLEGKGGVVGEWCKDIEDRVKDGERLEKIGLR